MNDPALTPGESTRPGMVVLRAGRIRRLGVPLFFGISAFLAATLATGSGHRDLAIRLAAIPAVSGLLVAVELWRRRAILTADGIEVRGLFRTRRIRYDQLKAFTYDARSYRLYLPIPIGRVARLALQGPRARVVFHAGFAHFDRHAPAVVAAAVVSTVQRMRTEIDRGQRARFGWRLRIDHERAYLRSLLRREQAVRLDDLRIDIADGSLFLSAGGRRLASFSLRRTPNLLALPQLVEELAANATSPRPDVLQAAMVAGGPRDQAGLTGPRLTPDHRP